MAMEGARSRHPADYSRFYAYPRLTPMVSPEAAKIAYDKAWAVFKAWPATDWSEARIKAFKAATGAWRVYLKAVKRIRPQKRQTP
jgi:hypothetical protein